MDTRKLKAFLAVASGLSLREAARTLNYAPSSLSAQITALEEDLGVTLFVRRGRDLGLSEQGARLLSHARRLVALEVEARSAVGAAAAGGGEVGLRISESLGIRCLPTVIARFRERFPGARLTVATASRHGLARDLARGATDLALILGERTAVAGLCVEEIGSEELVVILPPGSPQAGLAAVGPADLAGLPLILTRHVWSARRMIENAVLAAGGPAAGLVECASIEIVTRCVAAGLGVSVVPAFTVAAEVAAGQLATARWRDTDLSAAVLLIRDAGREPTPPAETLAELLRGFFAGAAHC